MKKISFGSFPFINIDKKTRFCLDKYLIKKFADQIVLTDIFKNIKSAKDYFYLTPDVIVDQLFNFEKGQIRTGFNRHGVKTRGFFESNEEINVLNKLKEIFEQENIIPSNFYIEKPIKFKIITEDEEFSYISLIIEEADDSGEDKKERKKSLQYSDPYFNIVKRAFFIIRKFYERLSRDPFYKDIVVLPVYSEKLEVIDRINFDKSQYNYSFFILTNDLLNDIKLDEISYNDAEVVNVLYIFYQLFPYKKLTDFNEKDLDIVIKFYKLFQDNNISPVEFFTALYYLLYVFSQVNSLKDFENLIKDSKLNNIFDPVIIDNIRNLFTKHTNSAKSALILFKDLKKFSKEYAPKLYGMSYSKIPPKVLQNFYNDLINTILSNKDIHSILINTAETIAKRQQLFHERIKFNDIITIFQELVKFNKKNFNDIVKDAGLELDFKIELKQEKISFNKQFLKSKLDQGYANFLKDFYEFLKKLNEELNNSLETKIESNLKSFSDFKSNMYDLETRLASINQAIKNGVNDYNQANEIAYNLRQAQELKNNLYNDYRKLGIENILNSGLKTTPDQLPNLEYIQKEEIDPLLIALQNYQKQFEALKIQLQQVDNDYDRMRIMNEMDRVQTKIYELADKYDSKKIEKQLALVKFELQDIKPELSALYESLERLFVNEISLEIFLNNPITTPEEYDEILKSKTDLSKSFEILKSRLQDIDIAIQDIVDVLLNQYEAKIKAFEATQIDKSFIKKIISLFDGYRNKYSKILYERIKKLIILRIFKIFAHSVKKTIENKEIQFKEAASGLHPLIAKLLKDPNNFKSFIFGFDMLLDLYNLIYLTDLQKYFVGSLAISSLSGGNIQRQSIPQKLTQPKNKIDYILTEVLKLENNPIWIVSRNKFYLSLPDYLSLLKQRVFSDIPKSKIENYCKIDWKKIWTEKEFGIKLSTQDKSDLLKEVKEISKTIDKRLKKIEELRKEKQKANKSRKKAIDKEIKTLQNEIEALGYRLKYLNAKLRILDERKGINLLSTIE